MSIDISTLSEAELKAALEQKQAAAKAEKEAAIRAYEKDRDQFVQNVVVHMISLSERLQSLKRKAIADGMALQERTFEVYGKKRKEKPVDHFTVTSADGKFKVQMERQYKGGYNETADVAIAEIQAVLKDKFEGRNKSLYKILDSVLIKNAKGDYDERLVAKLRKHESDVYDPRFSAALVTLSNAYTPGASQTYIRAYQLDEEGKWKDINVSFSSM